MPPQTGTIRTVFFSFLEAPPFPRIGFLALRFANSHYLAFSGSFGPALVSPDVPSTASSLRQILLRGHDPVVPDTVPTRRHSSRVPHTPSATSLWCAHARVYVSRSRNRRARQQHFKRRTAAFHECAAAVAEQYARQIVRSRPHNNAYTVYTHRGTFNATFNGAYIGNFDGGIDTPCIIVLQLILFAVTAANYSVPSNRCSYVSLFLSLRMYNGYRACVCRWNAFLLRPSSSSHPRRRGVCAHTCRRTLRYDGRLPETTRFFFFLSLRNRNLSFFQGRH